MKRYLLIGAAALLIFTGIYIDYRANKEKPLPRKTSPESSHYREAGKALAAWETARERNEIETSYEELLKNNTGKIKTENPYVINMQEGVNIAWLALPKEITVEDNVKTLRSADKSLYAGKTFFAGYYQNNKDKTVKIFAGQAGEKSPKEIQLEGLRDAYLYGFKTIKLEKTGAEFLVAMIFARDDSWSIRNFYASGGSGGFKKLYAFQGAWAEERYADLDGDEVLEMILQRRLNAAPPGAEEILKGLKKKNLTEFNAIFYEHVIIKWDDKGAKLVKAGSLIKADFSYKE